MKLIGGTISGKQHSKYELIYACSILLLLVFLFASVIFNGIAVLLVSVGWLAIGSLIINISFSKFNRLRTQKVWLLFFLVYYLYMIVTNTYYVKDPYQDFFFHLDSLHFYSSIDRVFNGDTSDSLEEALFEGRNWSGFAVVSWALAFVANMLGESNSIVLQKTQIVFASAMTIVVLYRAACLYFSSSLSWKIALTFGLLTHILAFSGTFTRDPAITLLFSIAFYIILDKWSIRGLFFLVLLGFIVAMFRFLHGVFFILIIATYIYIRFRSLENRIASNLTLTLLGVSFLTILWFIIQNYEAETILKIENYQEYHQSGFDDASGFTNIISRLPKALQPFGIMAISQSYPFPPARAVYVKAIRGEQLFLLPLILSQMFWIYVWSVLIYGVFYLKGLKLMPTNMKYGLLLAVTLILLISTSSYEYRRMMGAYPMIYLASAFLFYSTPMKTRTLLVFRLVSLQIILYLVYYIVKGVL